MIYPSIDKILNIVDSKYELVHIAARRAHQIEKDAFYQMKENEYNDQVEGRNAVLVKNQ